MHQVPFACDGSGSGFIGGLLDANYRANMTKVEALEFVCKAASHAMALDSSSGGMIRTLVVTKDGIEEGFVEGNKLPYGP